MRHRVGSITKTFTAAAVLQQVESGEIGLDTPIGHYLPRLVPEGLGEAVTVRMLINHTSGLAEYLPYAYPSLRAFPWLAETTPESLDENRFTRFHPTELIEMGVAAPAVGTPGGTPGVYSNTNYLLLCQLLERVTGTNAEKCITQNVIERAGLRDTELPVGPHISGPHSQMYEVVWHDRSAARLQRLRHVVGRAVGLADIDHGGSQPLLRFAACRRYRQQIVTGPDAADRTSHHL
jgi:D-alanyl-D-alanine carboxypeptidase